jgi:hypothetical protein
MVFDGLSIEVDNLKFFGCIKYFFHDIEPLLYILDISTLIAIDVDNHLFFILIEKRINNDNPAFEIE